MWNWSCTEWVHACFDVNGINRISTNGLLSLNLLSIPRNILIFSLWTLNQLNVLNRRWIIPAPTPSDILCIPWTSVLTGYSLGGLSALYCLRWPDSNLTWLSFDLALFRLGRMPGHLMACLINVFLNGNNGMSLVFPFFIFLDGRCFLPRHLHLFVLVAHFFVVFRLNAQIGVLLLPLNYLDFLRFFFGLW